MAKSKTTKPSKSRNAPPPKTRSRKTAKSTNSTRTARSTRRASNVFAPKGAIDLHVAPETRAALLELIDAKPKRLVIDLSRVPYVDSSGIAVLILAMQSLEQNGGQFLLAGAQDTVRTILESARLDQYFRLYPDIDAALAAT